VRCQANEESYRNLNRIDTEPPIVEGIDSENTIALSVRVQSAVAEDTDDQSVSVFGSQPDDEETLRSASDDMSDAMTIESEFWRDSNDLSNVDVPSPFQEAKQRTKELFGSVQHDDWITLYQKLK